LSQLLYKVTAASRSFYLHQVFNVSPCGWMTHS